MRKRFGWTAAALLGSASLAQAQPGSIGFYQPPVVSPYPQVSPFVNMIGSRSPAATYFGQVQPQIQAQANFMQISQSLQTMGQGGAVMAGAGASLTNPTALQTGHPVAFQNTGTYFPLFNRVGRAGGGIGGYGYPNGLTGFGGPFSQTLGSAFPGGAGTPFPMLNAAFPGGAYQNAAFGNTYPNAAFPNAAFPNAVFPNAPLPNSAFPIGPNMSNPSVPNTAPGTSGSGVTP